MQKHPHPSIRSLAAGIIGQLARIAWVCNDDVDGSGCDDSQ